MASLSAEEKIEFLLQVLATGEFTPDYSALATAMGINTKQNAQRRLKSIVEAEKCFVLKGAGSSTSIERSGKADEGEGEGEVDSGTPAKTKTPKSTKGKKRGKPATENEDEQNETPSKAARKTRKEDTAKLSEDGVDDGQKEISSNDDIV